MSQRLVNIVCIIVTLAASAWLYFTTKEFSESGRGIDGKSRPYEFIHEAPHPPSPSAVEGAEKVPLQEPYYEDEPI